MRQTIITPRVTLITILMLLAAISFGCSSNVQPIPTQPKPAVPTTQTQTTTPPSQSSPAPTPVPAQRQPSPFDGKATSLREILGSPKLYSGKDVVIEGVLFNICCGENFTFKDGLDSILVWVNAQSPMPPTSKTGSKIKVLGTVKVSFNDVGIVAKEIKYQ